jgi:nickel transport protein
MCFHIAQEKIIMKKNQLLIVLAVALTMFNWAGLVYGHAAIVWAYAENNQVHVEAFFASGKKIQNTRVIVVDENGDTVLEGKTDIEGKFSYKPVSKKAQTVVVTSGESHVGEFELTPEDLADIVLE